MTQERYFKPDAWVGPEGQLMAHVIYEAWAPLYPEDAKHFRPLVRLARADAMVDAMREMYAEDKARMDWLSTDMNYVLTEGYLYPVDGAKLRAFVDWCMEDNDPGDF